MMRLGPLLEPSFRDCGSTRKGSNWTGGLVGHQKVDCAKENSVAMAQENKPVMAPAIFAKCYSTRFQHMSKGLGFSEFSESK